MKQVRFKNFNSIWRFSDLIGKFLTIERKYTVRRARSLDDGLVLDVAADSSRAPLIVVVLEAGLKIILKLKKSILHLKSF